MKSSNNNNNDPTIENHQEETIQQNFNTIPENDLKGTDNLSASLEKLKVSRQELPKPPTLKKNTKVQL